MAMEPGFNGIGQDRSWKKRVAKERLILRQHAKLHYGAQSKELLAPRAPPRPAVQDAQQEALEALFRSASTPSLTGCGKRPSPNDSVGAAQAMGYMRQLPPLAGARQPSSGGTAPPRIASASPLASGCGPLRRAEATTAAPAAPPSQHGRRTPALPGGPAPAGRPPTVPRTSSGTASRAHTSLTRISKSSSLWAEVQQEVAKEVAKVIRPLQEQLESESAARLLAEEALAKAQVAS